MSGPVARAVGGAPEPREVAERLARAGMTDVDTSARRRAEYSSDASLYRVPPALVAFPRDDDDVLAAVEVCRTLGVPLTSRGGGTSVAGNAVGSGVILDHSRHQHRIRRIDGERATAEVEPGVVLDALQRAAAPHGLRFGPDPSTHDRCTMGGMLGNNACGSRALGYGRTADNVLALDVVTGAGERLTARAGADPAGSAALAGARRVADDHADLVRAELGRFPRQISGYALEHLLPEAGFDVAKALVGTEGTCALVLGATVRLVASPPATVLVLLGYPDMAEAADAVPALLEHEPVALEGLDARLTRVVAERKGPTAVPDLPRGGGWLMVELAGDDSEALESRAAALQRQSEALDSAVLHDPGHAAVLWRIRESGAGLASRSATGAPAHSGWEDAAVPPERLGEYLRRFEELLVEHGLTGRPFGHFGDGCVHVRLDFPFERPGGAQVFRSFLEQAAEVVADHGGSMSGEHGDGRARSELLPWMYSAGALRAFADFKAVFDPDDLLNPGVVTAPAALDEDLRPVDVPARREGLGFAYPEDGGDLAVAVHRCIGVGTCRADAADDRVMCPSYLATRDERDTTRGRARVLQETMRGDASHLGPGRSDGFRSPEVHEALDLCLSCKGCASDCPAGVDMATYKAEVLHQTYRRRLRPASHYAMGWLPRWARVAGVAPGVVNALLRRRPLARLAKVAGGIDPRRSLPTFAPRSFRAWFTGHLAPTRNRDQGDRPSAVLWVDTFTDRFTPEVAVAAVEVLESAGYAVRLPDRRLCCGLTFISTGQLDAAGRMLRAVVDLLAAEVRSGAVVVGLEPSCTAVLRSDARQLLGEDDAAARDVAAGTRTLAEVLVGTPTWQPPSLDGLEVVAQPHCHQHAVMGWSPERVVLHRAGAEVRTVGGCCGLAGNWGFERGHYDVSASIAETALLPAVRAAGEDAVVLADGFSCRTQIEQLSARRGVHLAELLAGSRGAGRR